MKSDAEILNLAADLIEKNGHAHGRLITDDGRMCIAGAINMAVNGDPCDWRGKTHDLLSLVGQYALKLKNYDSMNVVDWNNNPARTQASVVAALRETAQKVA